MKKKVNTKKGINKIFEILLVILCIAVVGFGLHYIANRPIKQVELLPSDVRTQYTPPPTPTPTPLLKYTFLKSKNLLKDNSETHTYDYSYLTDKVSFSYSRDWEKTYSDRSLTKDFIFKQNGKTITVNFSCNGDSTLENTLQEEIRGYSGQYITDTIKGLGGGNIRGIVYEAFEYTLKDSPTIKKYGYVANATECYGGNGQLTILTNGIVAREMAEEMFQSIRVVKK